MRHLLLILFLFTTGNCFSQIFFIGDTAYIRKSLTTTEIVRLCHEYGIDSARVNLYTALASKQPVLVSGTNIKTVNGNNILGSGDVAISGSAAWGSVTGTLSNQTDLQTALNGKLATSGNGSSLTGLTKSQVGLANADNTSDANKPISTATQTALDGKLATNGSAANLTGFPTLNQNTTGTAGGLSANIAESQVTNLVSDLAAKAPLASPAFTGTATGIGLPVYARVTGSNATTTGQALTTITGLSIALVAGAVYEVECMLVASTTAVTTGTGYGINYSVAGATIEGFVQGSATTTADKTLRLNAFNTSSQAWLTTSAQTGGILIKATVTVGANAGNLTAQHLKVTSGTSTVFIGSTMKVTRIL